MTSPPLRLSDPDRELLDLVSEAISVNPFTERRGHLDAAMASQSAVAGEGVAALDAAVTAVRHCVERLEATQSACPANYRGQDVERVRAGLLFNLFHSLIGRFDDHIEAQLGAGREPLAVPFAGECLDRLSSYGFAREEALRAFAAFFQLRRAFHFLRTGLVGRGAAMQRLRARLWNNVFTHNFLRYERLLWTRLEDFSLLLLGETGVGKGAAAAAVGRSGYIPFDERAGRFAESFTETFVAVNLSQFSESLIESEIFGHRKGSFTGAVADHAGLLTRCQSNGAIFLDEIGDLATPVQIKLLRVLQERVFAPVGSHDERRFTGRVIAATNRPLSALREGGRFRDDFFYRLCSDIVEVPTLRERLSEEPAEFDELLGHILKRICGDREEALVAEVGRTLCADVPDGYGWPGNVRELEQAVRAVLLNGRYIPLSSAAAEAADEDVAGMAREIATGALDARGLLAGYCRLLHARSGNYGDVARRTGLDRRTVRKYVASVPAARKRAVPRRAESGAT
jgi:DNA-binding NtrC family response regulator